ncbi:hypothetical protein [Metabacillus niabensis]|uniref:hypothetical protein n=1 Tax=Metabacillus niabensis TaxID=324854 RepID=UPI001CFA4B01|nr:hypothetical protein [Metabacillus niabensis]
MKITKIEWLSGEILEAEVEVTDGEHFVKCFAHPLQKDEGSELKDPIYCYDVTQIIKAEENKYEVVKLGNNFNYLLTGQLIDKNNEIVKLGEFLFELDSSLIPGDINEGDYISFNCERLDII